jgi:hypothetical protein
LQSGRLHFILDSLASICVRKGKGEVYAIAIQLQEHNGLGGTITLTIAGNHGVPNEVSSHLRKVWLQLQEIAQSYYTHYSNQKISIQYAEKSPPAREVMAVAKPLISQLKLVLYKHSFSKFASRVNKRYDKFIDFTEKLEKHLTMVPPTEQHHLDTWDSLLNVKFLV